MARQRDHLDRPTVDKDSLAQHRLRLEWIEGRVGDVEASRAKRGFWYDVILWAAIAIVAGMIGGRVL